MERINELFPRFDEAGRTLIAKAYTIAEQALKDMTRGNGKPFIEHPDAVARIADEEIGLPAECIAANICTRRSDSSPKPTTSLSASERMSLR